MQEIIEEKQEFIIDDDIKAEWSVKKIQEETAETQRYINVCETMINEYQLKIEKKKQELEQKTSYLKSKLFEYFNSIPSKKESKTQITYELPSAKLKLKKGGIEYIRNEEVLIDYLKKNNQEKYIKIKESVDWAELKKTLNVTNDVNVVDEDGQIIDGVKVQQKEDEFKIEF